MGWIDNAISVISPSWAYRREAWRRSLEEVRSYDAGSYSRLNSGWRVFDESAEMTDRYHRETVRARARDLERNSDMMNAVIRAYKRNTVGSGYRLQAKTDDQDLNRKIEELWKLWCKPRNCDVTGTQGFNQMLRMAVQRKKVDGGIIFVKRYTSDGILPFKLQMFEVDELDNSQTSPRNNGARVVGGIEYNSYNRPLGYWIRQYQIDGFTLSNPVYLEAKDVIFYFTKKRPSQIREMSDMTPTITRIRDANEFMTAVSVKERIAACLSVFIKKIIPSVGIGRGPDYLQRGAGAAAPQSYEGKTLSPGMIKELNAGDEVQVVNPNGQAQDATTYIKLQERMIAAGQGISYEAMSRDMSQCTYSSARQGIIEDELTYAEEEEQLIDVMDEIFETFMISCVLVGKIKIRDFWENKEKYFVHDWIKAPKKWIDPAKESTATKTALATGQKTFKQIAAENGKDWMDQIDDIVEVLNYAKKKGVDLGGVIFGQNSGLYTGDFTDGEE